MSSHFGHMRPEDIVPRLDPGGIMLFGDPYTAVAEQAGNASTPFFCTYIIMSLPNLGLEHDAGGGHFIG